MRVLLRIVFLTFVLSVVNFPTAPAAPVRKATKAPTRPINENDFDENPSPVKVEATRPTYPPNLTTPEEWAPTSRPNPRGNADLNFHLGILGGDVLDIGDALTTQFFGARYVAYNWGEDPRGFRRAWDIQADVHSSTLVSISGGRRWNVERDDFFQSYYRLGIGDYIKAADGIGGLINLRHFKILASFGSSDLFELHRQVTAEVGVGYGLGGFVSYLQLGYNFNLL